MKTCREFAKGLPHLANQVYMVEEYKSLNEYIPSYFYPMNTMSFKGDDLDAGEIEKLPVQKVFVKISPRQQAIEMELHVEEDWAYLVTEV